MNFSLAAAQHILNTMCPDKPLIIQIEELLMRLNRIGSLCIVSAITLSASVAPVLAQTPYDGLWSVTVVTKSGSCEPETRSTLTITDGKVSAAGADVTG